jgi:DNA-binding beta-propeller fold protein YncE
VYRLDHTGKVDEISASFGRPQGLAFDSGGHLHVVDALAGSTGLYRVDSAGSATCVLSAGSLVGLAFDPAGGMVVVSGDTAYRLDVALRPLETTS